MEVDGPGEFALAFDGSSFGEPVATGGGGDLVACASSAFCMAVDRTGRALTFEGGKWSAPVAIDGTNAFTSISCPSAAFCLAGDERGNVLTFSNGSWGAPTQVGDQGWGVSLSCVSVSFCLAASDGKARELRDGAWTSASPMSLGGTPPVACSSATFCTAVHSNQAATFNGTSWSQPVSIVPWGGLDSVSCPATLFCAAVTSNGPTSPASTFDGVAWSTPETVEFGYAPSSVSCPQPAFCVAVNSDRFVTLNDSTWSPPVTIDTPNELISVSCPTNQFCAAMDEDGRALTATVSGVPDYTPPTVGVLTRITLLKHRRVVVKLGCESSSPAVACRGIVSIAARIKHVRRRRIHGRVRQVPTTRTVLLAQAPYDVPSGVSLGIGLRVEKAASRALARVSKRFLLGDAVAALIGGSTVSRTISLRLSSHRAHN
jgi:hypothetical protein